VIVATGGYVIGSRYSIVFQRTARPLFDQSEFAPAVMLACGQGYATPAVANRALARFLSGEADTFTCSELAANTPHGTLDFMQSLYRYLMTAAGWQWSVTGISWSGLAPLYGILFALTLCAAYGLFRLAGHPVLALAGVFPLAVSAHHLAFLPQLRDYAKAPFILLLVLMIARIAMPPLDRRRALLWSAAFGGVLGIGFGFRNDLLINIPPFVGCVIFLLPGHWRDTMRLKAACLGVAFAVFVVSAWPILAAYRSGSNTGHVAVLGLTSTFDAPLGLTRPIYNLGPHYLDGYAGMMINGYNRLHGGGYVEYVTPEYDAAAAGLMRDVARHWPADVFVRALASAVKVVRFPFTVDKLTPAVPHGLTAPWLISFYARQQHKLRQLAPFAPWAVVVSLLVIGASGWRTGIAAGIFLLYYGGYPALQFSTRHYFHLEFVAWWAMLFLIARAIATRRISRDALRNAGLTAAVLLLLIVAPLWLLRGYQQRHIETLIDGYLRAHRVPAAVEHLWDNDRVDEPFDARYLALEFSSERCGAAEVPVTIRYDAKAPANDFTYVDDVAISPSGPTWRIVPVFYNGQWSHFAGVTTPAGTESCLKSVSRIDDLTGVPVFLDLDLAPGWRKTSLFQRIATQPD
jgi:hypothetical protein